jgi:DNA replication protein DnaC
MPIMPRFSGRNINGRRYRTGRASVVGTSNKPFGRRSEVFGDTSVAAAMIDRLVHTQK